MKRLTRKEMFSRMQLVRVIEPMTAEAYKDYEDRLWRENLDNSPHGRPWHVSFHASQFPGDDPMECPRAALYQMMDFAPEKPFNRAARTVMDAGKAIEVELVRRWHEAGILLSAPPDAEHQTGFKSEEEWLTASVDSIVHIPRTNWPTPVEVKTKYQKDIDEMKVGLRGPDEKHVKQVKVQIAFTRLVQRDLWPGLDICEGGYIFYLSRDRPQDTAEFYVEHDARFFEAGLERLREWRAYFEAAELPARPKEWKWTDQPCKWCDFKKHACKPDHKAGVENLLESNGVHFTQKIRPGYDPRVARARVALEWGVIDEDEYEAFKEERDKARAEQEREAGNPEAVS